MTVHPFERSITRFVEAVRDPRLRGAVFCTPRDAIETLATALACERSVLDGGRVVEVTEVLGDEAWSTRPPRATQRRGARRRRSSRPAA